MYGMGMHASLCGCVCVRVCVCVSCTCAVRPCIVRAADFCRADSFSAALRFTASISARHFRFSSS